MSVPVLIAAALAVWMVVLLVRGTWQERLVLVGAVVLGLLLPTVYDTAIALLHPVIAPLTNFSF